MKNLYKEDVCDWLRDAHIMENQAEKIFSGQAVLLKDFPRLRTRVESELDYIKKYKALLALRIEALGSGTSIIKGAAANIIVSIQNTSGLMVTDDPVKGMLALYTFTQMAIGSYKILIAAAESIGDEETKRMCKTIFDHTEIRAIWMKDELEIVTKKFMIFKAA